jgi:hypothetical protein
MKNKSLRDTLVVVVIMLLLVVSGSVGVLAQDTGTVEFTNLPEGATISSLTTMAGTITFPDFLKYEIFLKSGKDNLAWVANSHSPVVNGNLARLDPRMFVSGSYQVVVREVHKDSNYSEVLGPTINIDNPNGAPLPYYPEIEPSFLYPAEGLALIRARNCAGEDFFFDYASPLHSGSAGEMLLSGKPNGSICIFSDFVVLPAEYRGTAKGGAQATGAPLGFVAEVGKIYELTYFGGGHRIEVHEIPGDAKTGAEAPTTPPTATKAAAAPAPAPTQTNDILPITGNRFEGSSAFALVSIVLIIFLIGGGILAARRRDYTP